MPTGKLLHVTDRASWRVWLERNHRTEKEIWLVHYKKHTGRPRVSYEAAVEEALCFGWIDSTVKRLDDERYMHRYTLRKSKSVWSQLNKQRARKMTKQGRMAAAGLAAIKEARQNGQWDRPPRRQAWEEVPPELAEALAANNKAGESFRNLAPSYRRQYIRWLSSAKREETHRKRLREIVKLLSENKKLGMR